MNEPKYRLLQKGEKLQRGDQFRWDGKWEKWEGYEYENSQIIGVRYRTIRPAPREETPQTKPTPAAGMTPEQMRIALAKEMGAVESKDRFGNPTIEMNGSMMLLQQRGDDGLIVLNDLPNYTEDANAALEIVEMMRQRGLYWMGWKRFDEQYMVRFLSGAPDDPVHEAHAATLPLAICTAALKALGHLQ